MEVAPEVGAGAGRFSLGRAMSRDEIDYVVACLSAVLVPPG
jgi:hypothetical protein